MNKGKDNLENKYELEGDKYLYPNNQFQFHYAIFIKKEKTWHKLNKNR